MLVEKIISGGQTGADRAALDFALSHGLPHGGWCPRGRLAEDGPIPERYQLAETPGTNSTQRTEWNVRDSDGTVIFSISTILTGGSKRTADYALQSRKPFLHLAWQKDGEYAAIRLRDFLGQHRVRSLNVAGPRQSEEPEVSGFVTRILSLALE